MQDTVLPDINNLGINGIEEDFLNNVNDNLVNIQSVKTEDNLELQEKSYPYTLSLKIYEFEKEKDMFAFINNVKKLVRGSYEYKLWTNYIKDTLNYNKCILSNETGQELTIEIHHHPVSLQSIIMAILNTYTLENKSFCTFDIAMEVMKLHYQMNVGVIPLISSLHEKFHNGYLDLPIDLVIGNWKYLLDTYKFTDEQLEVIDRYKQYTSHNCIFYTACKLEKTTDEEAS